MRVGGSMQVCPGKRRGEDSLIFGFWVYAGLWWGLDGFLVFAG